MGKETVEQALGISAKNWILQSSIGKYLKVQGTPNPTSKAEDKKTGSFQVQVSVSDLRIRKEPSTSAPSAGMIAKGTHTITETVEGRWPYLGQLESGQGWIALDYTTRVSGEMSESSCPAKTKTGMNLDEIKLEIFKYSGSLGKIGMALVLSLMRKEL